MTTFVDLLEASILENLSEEDLTCVPWPNRFALAIHYSLADANSVEPGKNFLSRYKSYGLPGPSDLSWRWVELVKVQSGGSGFEISGFKLMNDGTIEPLGELVVDRPRDKWNGT